MRNGLDRLLGDVDDLAHVVESVLDGQLQSLKAPGRFPEFGQGPLRFGGRPTELDEEYYQIYDCNNRGDGQD